MWESEPKTTRRYVKIAFVFQHHGHLHNSAHGFKQTVNTSRSLRGEELSYLRIDFISG
jgi:hypothetical protein